MGRDANLWVEVGRSRTGVLLVDDDDDDDLTPMCLARGAGFMFFFHVNQYSLTSMSDLTMAVDELL